MSEDAARGDADPDFVATLAGLIGQPVGSSQPSVGPDPVNQPMIRHWAAAFEDANPVYTDPEVAAPARGSAAIVAPPLMLQTWTMATPMITGIAERGGSPVESTARAPLAVLRRGRLHRARWRRTPSSRSSATCVPARGRRR